MKNKLLLASAVASLFTGLAAAPSHAVTIDFDDLATQPVNGLTTNGVTFGFTVGSQLSADAVYNRPGPEDSTLLSGPVLEGDARGILSLTFVVPTRNLSFNVALSVPFNLVPGISVTLTDVASGTSSSQGTNTFGQGDVSEGRFNFSGELVSRAEIAFLNGSLPVPQRFALDSLTFLTNIPDPGDGGGNDGEVPAPPPIALIGAGLLALGALRRRASKSRNVR